MKKLFYGWSSRRSFAKLFSLLACVALGCLFAQQAIAQDFFFGWEPAPPSSWDGGWDATLSCGSVVGTTELSRTPPSGPDSVVQHGTVICTFTDTARNFTETATCLVDPDNGPIQFGNLSESSASCVDNVIDGTSTLTITGMCPFKKGNTIVGATGSGTIDCRGRNADGSLNMNNNPKFCSYAGTNPNGNPPVGTAPNVTQDCRWNMGFGALKSNGDIVPLTQSQCETAFPATSELALAQVFNFTQRYSVPGCTGTEFAGVGTTTERLCHSDTWDGSKPAFCTFPQGGGAKNTVLGKLANHLTVDTEYQPTVNPTCNPTNSGIVNLTVYAVNRDPDHPDNNTVALEEIDQSTITVNGNPVATKSGGTPDCSFDVFPNPNVMTCNINRCEGGRNIIIPGTSTLVMEALMSDGSPVAGDVETVNVSGK